MKRASAKPEKTQHETLGHCSLYMLGERSNCSQMCPVREGQTGLTLTYSVVCVVILTPLSVFGCLCVCFSSRISFKCKCASFLSLDWWCFKTHKCTLTLFVWPSPLWNIFDQFFFNLHISTQYIYIFCLYFFCFYKKTHMLMPATDHDHHFACPYALGKPFTHLKTPPTVFKLSVRQRQMSIFMKHSDGSFESYKKNKSIK